MRFALLSLLAVSWAIALMTGCGSALSDVSIGLDGAAALLKAQCPQRTDACEKGLDAYNAATAAYNLALLAKSVHAADADAQADAAEVQLLAAYQSLQGLVAK